MTVRRNQGTGMFTSDIVAGSFYTKEEAEEAEAAGSYTNETGPDASEFSQTMGDGSMFLRFADDITAPGQASTYTDADIAAFEKRGRTRPQDYVPTAEQTRENRRISEEARAQGAFRNTGNIGGAAGAYNTVSDRGRAAFDYYRDIRDPTSVRDFLNAAGEDVGVSRAGEAIDPGAVNIYGSPEALIRGTTSRVATNLGTTADRLGGLPMTQRGQMSGDGGVAGAGDASTGPGDNVGDREDAAERRANAAGQQFQDEFAENEAENAEAWDNAWNAIDAIEGGDYGMSDEARAFQKEGLQMQRDLLERTLGFDPNAYAAQFQDQALARNIALARGTPGGAAAQQAGIFAALEGAPALYAEGARQASALENQRLGAAAGITEAFGNLGTMTRNSDEARAQFESNLSVEIADQVGRLTQGQVSLNNQESSMFAELWTNFAELQSRYAGMDSDEQLAWWDREMQQAGLDQQWAMMKEGFKQEGKVTSKDIVGGLFQLGGGIIGAGGQIMAARAGGNRR